MKVNLLYSLILFVLLCFNSTGYANEKPSVVINKFHDALKKNSLSSKDKIQKKAFLTQIVSETFNYPKMIKFIYGRGWKNLNSELKNNLEETFLNFISHNYVERFGNVKDLDFKYKKSSELEDRKIIVETHLISSNSEPIKINYLLEEINSKWKVFDILLTGSISEIATKKSEFFSIIRKSGAEGLIEKINQKINK